MSEHLGRQTGGRERERHDEGARLERKGEQQRTADAADGTARRYQRRSPRGLRGRVLPRMLRGADLRTIINSVRVGDMTSLRRLLPVLGLAAASALVLAGCAGTAEAGDERRPALGRRVDERLRADRRGDRRRPRRRDLDRDVNESQDPHSFEPSAQDQLAVPTGRPHHRERRRLRRVHRRAHRVERHRGAGRHRRRVLARLARQRRPRRRRRRRASADGDAATTDADEHERDEHDHEHVEGFNEHVWYDPHTIAHVAAAIADELGALSPADADDVHRERRGVRRRDRRRSRPRSARSAPRTAASRSSSPSRCRSTSIAAAGLENVDPRGVQRGRRGGAGCRARDAARIARRSCRAAT